MDIKSYIRSNFSQKLLRIFFTKGIALIISISTSSLLGRVLGPAGNGVLGAAVAIGGIGAQFLNLGMHASSKYQLIQEPGSGGRLVGNLLALSGISALFGGFLFVFLSSFSSLTVVKGIMLAAACILIPISLYYLFQQEILIGIDAIRQYNMYSILKGILYLTLLLVFSVFHLLTPEKAIFSMIFSMLIVIILTQAFFLRELPPPIRPDWPLFKRCLPFGMKSYTACLCSYLVIRSDVLMISYMLGDEQTGFYTMAVSLANVVESVPSVIGMLLFSETVTIRSEQKRSKFMKSTLVLLAVVMGMLTITATFLSKFAVEKLYGKTYAPSVKIFNILMIGIFFLALQSVLSNYFAAKNMWTGNILTPLAGFIINILANIILIPQYGINGAAIASVLSYAAMFFIMFGRFLTNNRAIAAGG